MSYYVVSKLHSCGLSTVITFFFCMEAFGLCILFASRVNREGRAQAIKRINELKRWEKRLQRSGKKKKKEEKGVEDMSTREAIESVGMWIL